MTTTLHFTPAAKSRVIQNSKTKEVKLCPQHFLRGDWQPVSVILTSDEPYKDGAIVFHGGIVGEMKGNVLTNQTNEIHLKRKSLAQKIVAAYPSIPNIPTISESDLPYLIEMGNAGCFDVEVKGYVECEEPCDGECGSCSLAKIKHKVVEGFVVISREKEPSGKTKFTRLATAIAESDAEQALIDGCAPWLNQYDYDQINEDLEKEREVNMVDESKTFTPNEVAQLMVIQISKPDTFTENNCFNREKFDNYINNL